MFCQKCRTPLKLDSSLENLSPAAFNLLTEATAAAQKHSLKLSKPLVSLYSEEQGKVYQDASRSSYNPVFRIGPSHALQLPVAQDAPPTTNKDNPAMSFVMLTESQLVPSSQSQLITAQGSTSRHIRKTTNTTRSAGSFNDGNLLPHKMDTVAKLFEILSSRSDIDYPVCTECTDRLIDGMEKRLDDATQERDAFIDFLRSANADVSTEDEKKQAEKHLEALRHKEEQAFAELQELERENMKLEAEILSLEIESQQLDEEEKDFWRERNSFSQTLSDFQDERDSVNIRYEHDLRQLAKLQRTNVYNDTFCISYDGLFVTINGLRLGRLSNPTVEWPEINAAWGQTCLLLATVAEKLNFNFQGYRLNPLGSTSTISKIEPSSQSSMAVGSAQAKPNVTTLDLFYSGDLPVSLPFLHRSFDNAMVAFLECVRQLGKHIERRQIGQKLPYEIKKDKIGDVSIKLGGFKQEDWTRACKYTLTCCKYLLAHASNPSGATRTSST